VQVLTIDTNQPLAFTHCQMSTPAALSPPAPSSPKPSNWSTTLNDLINQAYGLTPAEIELLWKTAPPRMPITAHAG
jgi:hypothetical protein